MTDQNVRVLVKRPKGPRDLLRSYNIILDGQRVGRIRQGHRLELTTTPGRHTIRAAIDWSGSPEVEFSSGANSTVEVEVKAGSVWTGFRDLFTRTQWIDIAVTDSA